MIDDNVCASTGHYSELSSLLLSAAVTAGYLPVLAANAEFKATTDLPENTAIHRVFSTRRMTRWSCGVDGRAKYPRDIDGSPLDKSLAAQATCRWQEWISRARRRPTQMMAAWKAGITQLLDSIQPTRHDVLVFQTADDFMMLALASALVDRARRAGSVNPLDIHAIFHYAARDRNSVPTHHFDDQLNNALDHLSPHQVSLYATTHSLANQLNSGDLSSQVQSIRYPIRPPQNRVSRPSPGRLSSHLPGHSPDSKPRRPRVFVGGAQRVEQGQGTVTRFLEDHYQRFFGSGSYELTIQLPAKRWEPLIPTALHDDVRKAIKQPHNPSPSSLPSLDVRTSGMTEPEYHAMLGQADLALLMYEPSLYEVRCSGVLLELLVRGVPVVVPNHCWLADTVRKYSDNGPVGYIYNHPREVPKILEQFLQDGSITSRAAAQAAPRIAADHSPGSTLLALGKTLPTRLRVA